MVGKHSFGHGGARGLQFNVIGKEEASRNGRVRVDAGEFGGEIVDVDVEKVRRENTALKETNGSGEARANFLVDNELRMARREKRVDELNEWKGSLAKDKFVKQTRDGDTVICFFKVQKDMNKSEGQKDGTRKHEKARVEWWYYIQGGNQLGQGRTN